MSLQVRPRKIKATGEIVYYLTGTHLNQRIRRSLGTSDLKEAKRIAAEVIPKLMHAIADGTLKSDSFAAVAAAYVAKGKSARFLDPLIAKFGKRSINEIQDAEVFAHADAQKGWTPQTKNRQVLVPFQAVANFGARQRPPKCAPRLMERYDEPRRVITAAPDDWFRAVIAACEREKKIRMIGLIMFLSLTAVRISEACRLQWIDVNLDEGWALIRRTKSGHPRRVELHSGVVSVLSNLERKSDRAPVFGYAHRSGVAKALSAICRRAGLDYYSSHQWGRHAFATRLLRMNKSLLMVKQGGGWASLQVVVDNYGHLEQSDVSLTIGQGADEFSRMMGQDQIPGTNADTPAIEHTKNNDKTAA